MAANQTPKDTGGKRPGQPSVGTPTVNAVVNNTAGNTAQTVTVPFTAPAYLGKSGAVTYTVTASTGQSVSGASSPLTVTGLTAGTAVTFTVTATSSGAGGNAVASVPSAASGSVTPPYFPP
jgi:hypothetical protein